MGACHPVPLDYRDLVRVHRHLDQINEHIAEFATDVTATLQSAEGEAVSRTEGTRLSGLRIGAPAAENEEDVLGHYFMQTDEYQRTERGECQIVSGRKGAGKTAMFVQLRNQLRRKKSNIVLDLRPESFQLQKFRDLVSEALTRGSREHVITAFWEYLLLLEVGHKLLQKDKQTHLSDHTIYKQYHSLHALYYENDRAIKGDFAERMTGMLTRLNDEFTNLPTDGSISRDEIGRRMYSHDVPQLKEAVIEYLLQKSGVWILVDNLDKGWPSHGVTSQDTLILRCLTEAMFRISKSFRKNGIKGFGVVFIRNDVFELLIDHTADRGKISRANIDWDDPDLLRELLRLRMTARDEALANYSFSSVWGRFCVSHIRGEESSQFVLDRCLMRPRALIEFIGHCRSHAVNLNRQKIEESDFLQGEAAFSSNLVTNISLEIRDIMPDAGDFAYGFLESKSHLSEADLKQCLESCMGGNSDYSKIVGLLLWFGFIGFIRSDQTEAYIHTVKYDMKRLNALINKVRPEDRVYCINKAFWAGLEIKGEA